MSRTTPERGHARGLRGAGRHLPYKPPADRRRPRAPAPTWPVRFPLTPVPDDLDALLCAHASAMHGRRALEGAAAHGDALMAVLGLSSRDGGDHGL